LFSAAFPFDGVCSCFNIQALPASTFVIVGPVTTTSTVTTTTNNTATEAASSRSTGAVVGGVVGFLLLASIVAGAVYYVRVVANDDAPSEFTGDFTQPVEEVVESVQETAIDIPNTSTSISNAAAMNPPDGMTSQEEAADSRAARLALETEVQRRNTHQFELSNALRPVDDRSQDRSSVLGQESHDDMGFLSA
jgi:hypothetical protein